jgi:alkylation response protein AidB-like acyl-CoA dehydrogenase
MIMVKGCARMDRFELRRQDFSLDESQLAVRNAFAEFFAKECPTSVVRAAEPLGHDKALWRQLVDMGVAAMGLPEAVGGDQATLVDLALIGEEVGRTLAPVPFVSHVVGTRVLAQTGAAAETLSAAMQGERTVTVALQPGARRQLVPDAAVSADVIAFDDETLVLHRAASLPAHVANQGCTPLAWWQPDATSAQTVLATGAAASAAYREAIREWKLLTASTLVGITEAALRLAVEFAKTRETMGVPIGSLQGVSFPLADVAIAVSGARNLVWKAAWFAEHEPDSRPELGLMAFDYAVRTATHGVSTSAHMQGGLGFTTEADASLYFLRAKGWSALGGDPADDRRAVGAHLIGDI